MATDPGDDDGADPGAIRRAFFQEDRDQMSLILLFQALFVLVYVPLEVQRFAGDPLLTRLALVRVGLLAGLAVMGFTLSRVSTPRGLDRIVYALVIVGVPAVITLNMLYGSHFATDLVILIAIYIAIPAPFPLQIAGAVTLSLADVYINQFMMTTPDLNDVFATHLFANLFGIALRRRQLRIRRELFETNREEALVRSELEDALRNVRQLSGLLPICAVCKKIRDDEEEWQPIEAYIDQRSEASFTHSYCPTCAEAIEKADA